MKEIKITTGKYQFTAQLYDTPTANEIWKALPIKAKVSTWGSEIYFRCPVYSPLEVEARAEVEIGDLAYWPDMPAFCIFFGRTPVSPGEKPVAAGPVNVFGKIEKINVEKLKNISSGDEIIIEKNNY